MGKFVTGFAVGSITAAAACYYLFKEWNSKPNRRDSLATTATNASIRRRAGDLDNINLLTDLIQRLWIKLGPAIGDTIKSTVEPMLKDLLPGPLSDLHFIKCDFGKVPIQFDNVIVHPLLNDGSTIQFDLDVVWNGACDIQLQTSSIKLGVRNIKLFGRMQFIMAPLTDILPCIGAIQYAFVNKPLLELDFTGLANIADFGVGGIGIDKKIRRILDDVIENLMVLPTRMMYKMDPLCDYRNAFQSPAGIARISAVSGRNFQVQKSAFKDDIPDIYLIMTLGTSINPKCKTSVQKNSLMPVWNESFDFLLSDTDQILSVHAWDEDRGVFDSDDDLGVARVTIADILMAKGKILEVELLNEANIGTGAFVTIQCDVCKLKVYPKAFEIISPTTAPIINNELSGLLTIIVTKAFDLPLYKDEVEVFVKIKYGDKEFLTGIVVDCPDYPGFDCLNPVFDVSFLVPITSRELVENNELPDVEFELVNSWKNQTLLGTISIPPKLLLEAPGNNMKESRYIGSDGARLEFQVSLHGIEKNYLLSSPLKPHLRVSQTSTDQSATNVSSEEDDKQSIVATDQVIKADEQPRKVKVTVVNGHGFSARKRKFRKVDVPDLCCGVKFGSSPNVWRTLTIYKSVCPEWNESKVYTLASENQVISLDVWDCNRIGDDTFIGSFRVTVGKVLLNSGEIELELEKNGSGIGAFVTVACELE